MSDTKIMTREEASATSERQVDAIAKERWPELKAEVAKAIMLAAMDGRNEVVIQQLPKHSNAVRYRLESMITEELVRLGYVVESKLDTAYNSYLRISFDPPKNKGGW